MKGNIGNLSYLYMIKPLILRQVLRQPAKSLRLECGRPSAEWLSGHIKAFMKRVRKELEKASGVAQRGLSPTLVPVSNLSSPSSCSVIMELGHGYCFKG